MTVTAPSAAPPTIGAPAPDFTLASTGGAPVSLVSLRGQRVLIAFFPLAFTSTCTAEMCAFSDDYDAFADEGVTVLPISVDSVPTLSEFKAKHALKTEFLSDFRRDVSRAYGVLLEHTFFATRAYFLLDRDGIVRWSHVEENPGLRRDDAELLAAIRANS
ncbi:MAG TPA: redoxin domain-containing protein [Gemmatirosa sp.]